MVCLQSSVRVVKLCLTVFELLCASFWVLVVVSLFTLCMLFGSKLDCQQKKERDHTVVPAKRRWVATTKGTANKPVSSLRTADPQQLAAKDVEDDRKPSEYLQVCINMEACIGSGERGTQPQER